MRSNVEHRLQQLLAEREAGQKLLADLDARRATLGQTMLRIDGAIAVLRELLEVPRSEPRAVEAEVA